MLPARIVFSHSPLALVSAAFLLSGWPHFAVASLRYKFIVIFYALLNGNINLNLLLVDFRCGLPDADASCCSAGFLLPLNNSWSESTVQLSVYLRQELRWLAVLFMHFCGYVNYTVHFCIYCFLINCLYEESLPGFKITIPIVLHA